MLKQKTDESAKTENLNEFYRIRLTEDLDDPLFNAPRTTTNIVANMPRLDPPRPQYYPTMRELQEAFQWRQGFLARQNQNQGQGRGQPQNQTLSQQQRQAQQNQVLAQQHQFMARRHMLTGNQLQLLQQPYQPQGQVQGQGQQQQPHGFTGQLGTQFPHYQPRQQGQIQASALGYGQGFPQGYHQGQTQGITQGPAHGYGQGQQNQGQQIQGQQAQQGQQNLTPSQRWDQAHDRAQVKREQDERDERVKNEENS